MSRSLSKKFNNLMSQFLTPSPKEVEGLNNSSYGFYRMELYQMVKSVLKLENAPENWNIDYILDNLFQIGYLTVVKTKIGVLALEGGYSGINMYGFPTRVIVANPVLGSITRTIGKDGELLYFQYTNNSFPSIEPLIKRYAVILANCDGSINTNLINSRLAHIFLCDNKANEETAKYVYDEISKGNPAVFVNKGGMADVFTNVLFGNVKNVFIGRELLETKRMIYSEFLTAIGINNINIDKRERMNSNETQSKNGEVLCLLSLWKDTLNRCLDNCKKTFASEGFPQNISFEYNMEVVQQLKGDYINESDKPD